MGVNVSVVERTRNLESGEQKERQWGEVPKLLMLWQKCLKRSSLRKEVSILAHGLGKDVFPCAKEVMVAGVWGSRSHCVCNQEAERGQEVGLGYKTSKPAARNAQSSSSNPLPPKGSTDFPNSPIAWDQIFKHMSSWGTLHIQTSTQSLMGSCGRVTEKKHWPFSNDRIYSLGQF